jgi:SPP1 gp7 family putative phage head morphogenesis protein
MLPAEFFQLPPQQAVEALRKRGVVLPDEYRALAPVYRQHAFSITGVAAMDSLQGVLDDLRVALEGGQTFAAWKKAAAARPGVAALPPGRLDTIFRTNLQGAYHRGIYQRQADSAESRPFLMYDAINDSRVRPTHLAMDGFIARHDDPIWKTHRPPMGYRCRCTLVSLTQAQAEARGLGSQIRPAVQPDPGWEYDRADGIEPGIRKAQRRAAQAAPKLAAKRPGPAPSHIDVAQWKQIEGQRGSNPGGVYEDADGQRWYVKFPGNPEQARSEALAARVYGMLGLRTLDPTIVTNGSKVGIATKWVEGLRKLTPAEVRAPTGALREELAAVYHGSVLTKNWDVVGLDNDNLLVNAKGQLVVADTGGAFRFRAQGGAKDYGPDIGERATLLDDRMNPASARVFSFLADDPVIEDIAARRLKGVTDKALYGAAKQVGWNDTESAGITRPLLGRLAALDLLLDYGDKLRQPGFGKVFDKLYAKHGGGALRGLGKDFDGQSRGNNTPDIPVEAARLALSLMPEIEAMFRDAGLTRASSVTGMFRDWSGYSSSSSGAAMKLWAADRFGVKVGYHDGSTNAAEAAARHEASLFKQRSAAEVGFTREQARAALDIEYEFTQYVLRRAFGFTRVKVRREMSQQEFKERYVGGKYTPNAVTSTAYPSGSYTASRAVLIEARVEDFSKVYWQGLPYLSYGSTEREFIMLGRARPATVVK